MHSSRQREPVTFRVIMHKWMKCGVHHRTGHCPEKCPCQVWSDCQKYFKDIVPASMFPDRRTGGRTDVRENEMLYNIVGNIVTITIMNTAVVIMFDSSCRLPTKETPKLSITCLLFAREHIASEWIFLTKSTTVRKICPYYDIITDAAFSSVLF